MGLAIPIETSARHIHLCQEDFEKLFGEEWRACYEIYENAGTGK